MSLICPECGKTYKQKKSYETHVSKHSGSSSKASVAVSQPVDESNFGPELPEDDNLSELPSETALYLLNHDEDEETVDDPSSLNVPNADQPPPIKRKRDQKSKKHFLVRCGVCGKTYVTLDSYVRHSLNHRTDVYAVPPELTNIQEESIRMAEEVLRDIMEFNSKNSINGERIIQDVSVLLSQMKSEKFREFVNCICENVFECFKLGNNFVMPSQIREKFVMNAALFMVDLDKRSRLMCILIELLNFPQHKLDVLLSAFLRRLSQKIIAFILHWLVHGEGSPIVKFASQYHLNEESNECLEFKQVMHYVGGANVLKVLKNCLRLKTPTEESTRIVDVIKTYFIVSDEAEAPDSVLMEWTVSQDRGKLVKISARALDFFVFLGKTVQSLEHVDGSLWIDEVIEKVSNSPHLVFLWDDLVKDFLPQEESFQLLYSLCYHFCVTWRNGIISRRMDEIHRTSCKTDKFGKGGVAFRAKVG